MVTIPAGASVLLDVDTPVLDGVMVHGELVFEDKAGVGLSAQWVMIMGPGSVLRAGSESGPYFNQTHITLHGTDRARNVSGEPAPWNSGNKFLMAMDGGTLALHGASRAKTAWTKLGATAAAGATTLTLERADTGWSVGDKLVVGPTGFSATTAEEVTITAIDGASVTFSPALAHPHWGQLQSFGGTPVDERAVVGLLTRNIQVRGAADSDAQKFGAHLMIMGGLSGRPRAYGYVEGVEFTRTGQAGLAGRYTFHWHWVGEGDGQYFRDNSIHHAFQRAANVHRTSGVLVEDNVAYHVQNHNYVWAEDGHETEFNNTFRRNLAVRVIHPPTIAEFAFGERDEAPATQEEWRTSGFWGRNTSHVFEGNHVAGVQGGMGYFFDIGGGVGPDPKLPHFRFEDNTAQSCTDLFSGLAPQNDMYPPLVRGVGLFVSGRDAGPQAFSGLRAFKNKLGAWMEAGGHTVTNSVFSNNAGAMFCLISRLENSVVVGRTANTQGNSDYVRLIPAVQIGTVGVDFAGVITFNDQGGPKSVRVANTRFHQLHSAITLGDTANFYGGYVTGLTVDAETRPVFGMNLFSGALLDLDGSLDPGALGRPTWLTFADNWFIHSASRFDHRLALWRTPDVGRIIRPASATQFLPYGPHATTPSLIDQRLGLRATGRGGFALPLDYEVTPDTMLEFYASENTLHGDEQWHYVGLGLDEDLNPSNARRLLGLNLKQTPATNNNRAFPSHAPTDTAAYMLPRIIGEPGKVFRIPLGRFYTGPMRYLVFYGDALTANPALPIFDLQMIRVFERADAGSRGWMVRREIFNNIPAGGDGLLTFADLQAKASYPNSPDSVRAVNPYYGTNELREEVELAHSPAYQVQRQNAAAVDKTYLVVPTNGVYEFALESGMTNFRLEIGIIRSTGLTWTTVLEENRGLSTNAQPARRVGSMNLRAGVAYPWRLTTLSSYAAVGNGFKLTWRPPGQAEFTPFDITWFRPAANDVRVDANLVPDADRDGLDDRWELSFGLDPLFAEGRSGAEASPMGDGVSNQHKFLLGLNPLLPAVVPVAAVSTEPDLDVATIGFPALRGRTYQLEQSIDLTVWTKVGEPRTTGAADTAMLEWVADMDGHTRVFYRVVVTALPSVSFYVPPVDDGSGGTPPSYP
jgi:cell migration-inducing and hyaluronan-binding protein